MITRGIVEQIVDKYHIRVRIPIYNRVSTAAMYTPTEELSVAVICTAPYLSPNFQLNDIVIVGFEDNDLGKPIILGMLFRDIDSRVFSELLVDTLTVNSQVNLPENTTIGKIKAKELASLAGVDYNLADKIQSIEDRLIYFEPM